MIEVHKFNVGQLVQFHPDRNEQGGAARGPYEVTKRLPHNGRESLNPELEAAVVKTARDFHAKKAREQERQNPANENRNEVPSNRSSVV